MEGVPKSRIDHRKFISHCVVDSRVSILFPQCLIPLSRSKPFGGRPWPVGMLWWGGGRLRAGCGEAAWRVAAMSFGRL